MTLQWRVFDRCLATHPTHGIDCEREAGHDREHYYTVWEWSPGTEENYPSYPVLWADRTEGKQ